MRSNESTDAELTADAIYKGVDMDVNLSEDEGDGVFRIGSRYGDLHALIELEEFLSKVERTDEPAYRVERDEAGRVKLTALELAYYTKLMNAFGCAYSEKYAYSEPVTAFFETRHLPQFHGVDFSRPRLQWTTEKITAEVFNDFIDRLRKRIRDPRTKKKVARQVENALRNRRNIQGYIDGLFDRFSRLLILRVDLGYRREQPGAVTLEKVRQDLRRFINNMRGNQLFQSMVGYIWKLEYGEDKGYHFHFMFFYDGSKVRKDVYLGNKIGEYWKGVVTEGRGIFFNCNANEYKWRGIGMVNHSDHQARANLSRVVEYLAKKDQYLRLKLSAKGRVLGRGVLPKARMSRAGRPRKAALAAPVAVRPAEPE